MLFLNKLLPLFVLPLGFSLLCLVAGLVLRKRFLLWFGVLVLLIFSMPVFSNKLMGLVEGSTGRTPLRAVVKADAIVVLSGMLHQVDGVPLGEWGDAGIDVICTNISRGSSRFPLGSQGDKSVRKKVTRQGTHLYR